MKTRKRPSKMKKSKHMRFSKMKNSKISKIP